MATPSASRNSHRRLDERSLALHRLVVEKLRADPSLLDRVRENLARWSRDVRGSWIDEWSEIIDGPFDALLSFLVEDSERAVRLRQSSPFTGVLDQRERMEVYRRFSPPAH